MYNVHVIQYVQCTCSYSCTSLYSINSVMFASCSNSVCTFLFFLFHLFFLRLFQLITLCEGEDAVLSKFPCYKGIPSLLPLKASGLGAVHVIVHVWSVFGWTIIKQPNVRPSLDILYMYRQVYILMKYTVWFIHFFIIYIKAFLFVSIVHVHDIHELDVLCW